MKRISLLLLVGALATSTVSLNSCIKKNFDAPTDQTGIDPKLTVTHTIAQVLQMPINTAITEDVVVSGVVVMDDRSGNYYKKFVIQDSTGGLEINLDQNNIYTDYPVGRKVYIKAKGLALAVYGGMIQMGYGVDERQAIVPIPFTMAGDYIVKANFPNTIKVDTFDYDQLANPNTVPTKLNTLVAIRNAQFVDTNATYAAPNATTNRNLTACNTTSTKIVVRSSNYAKFQPIIMPKGSGVITGLYTKYQTGANATAQLIIRDTADVKFYNARCGAGSNPPGGTVVFTENFNSGTANSPIALAGWTNVSEAGTVKYTFAGSTNLYAKITAYGTGQADVKSWLITPAINLTGVTNPALTLRSTYGFADAATFKAYITTSFNGNPTAATWTELPAITVPGQANWSWQNININLAAYAGQTVYIGFKYVGSATGATGTYEIDDIKVAGN